MELLADRDPEEARKILDPVLEHMMDAVHRYEGTVNQVMVGFFQTLAERGGDIGSLVSRPGAEESDHRDGALLRASRERARSNHSAEVGTTSPSWSARPLTWAAPPPAFSERSPTAGT